MTDLQWLPEQSHPTAATTNCYCYSNYTKRSGTTKLNRIYLVKYIASSRCSSGDRKKEEQKKLLLSAKQKHSVSNYRRPGSTQDSYLTAVSSIITSPPTSLRVSNHLYHTRGCSSSALQAQARSMSQHLLRRRRSWSLVWGEGECWSAGARTQRARKMICAARRTKLCLCTTRRRHPREGTTADQVYADCLLVALLVILLWADQSPDDAKVFVYRVSCTAVFLCCVGGTYQ